MAAVEEEKSSKQTILVTGANKGIGLSLCQQLVLNPNIQVIVGCRNFNYVPKSSEENAKKHADNYEVVKDDNSAPMTRLEILQKVRFKDVKNVDFVELDICDQQSVTKAADQIKEKYQNIDILVNNAGLAFKGSAFDTNVVNTTMATNYDGTVRVTEAMLPLVKDGGRVLFVSSRAGLINKNIKDEAIRQQLLKADLTQKELDGVLDAFKKAVEQDQSMANAPFAKSAYGMSKVAMSAYSRIVASQLKGRSIFVGAYCPGWCQTSMSSGTGTRTSAQGAKGIELLCLDKLDMEQTGKFWGVDFTKANKDGSLVNYDWSDASW